MNSLHYAGSFQSNIQNMNKTSIMPQTNNNYPTKNSAFTCYVTATDLLQKTVLNLQSSFSNHCAIT